MHREMKGLLKKDRIRNGVVNIQVHINRAVWACNLDEFGTNGSFDTEEQRDAYVKICLEKARKTLNEILQK